MNGNGGRALADVLTGAANPCGRLPFSIPTPAEHLPFFDRTATTITYDRFHGQRLLDRLGVAPAFPHGFGLSYTTFGIDAVSVDTVGPAAARVTATVSNQGDRDGRHVVQVYGSRADGSYAGERMLVGFSPVDVPAQSATSVEIAVSLTPLAEWDPTSQRRVSPAPGDVTLWVGSHARDELAVVVRLP